MPVCEICNNKYFKLITTQIREGKGKILRCNHCGLIIQDISWGGERLRRFYEKDYQKANSFIRGKTQTPLEHFKDRLKTITPIFNQIKPLLKPKSKVLEIGCGSGELLYLIKPHVAKCVGTELNTPFVGFINKNLKIKAYNKDINELALEDSFDLVISIATIDHLPNPYQTLITIKKLLLPKGKIYIEIPNYKQALNYFLPDNTRVRFNEFFWQRAHFFYFTKETISALFKKVGLKIGITCRHDYTLKNFLNWYFVGKPQPGLVHGMTDSAFFTGETDFEKRMNQILKETETEFKKTMAKTFRGESLCCIGYV